MAEIIKPTMDQWASTGAWEEPTDAKKAKGWVSEKPQFEIANWLFRIVYDWLIWFIAKYEYAIGCKPDEALTMSAGSITPTQEGVKVATSGAMEEELLTAGQSNLDDGRLLMVRPDGDANIVALKFNDGGAGQFMASNQKQNRLKNSVRDIWIFQRVGTSWLEVLRPAIQWPLGRGNFIPLFNTTFKLAKHTGRGATLALGGHPDGVCFDGTYIWVTINSTGQVKKIDPATCAVVATIAVGTGPREIYFDGRWIWVANTGGDSISKIDPVTNTVIATITDTAIDAPRGMILANGYIFVCNYDRNSVCWISQTGNAVMGESYVGTSPVHIEFDGSTYLYFTNFGSDQLGKMDIYGTVTGLYSVTGVGPWGIAFDGIYLWVSNNGAATVSKIDRSVSPPVKIADYAVGTNPRGVLFDGMNIFVFNFGSDDISMIDVNNGAAAKTFSAIDEPTAGAFDGVHVWVPNADDNLIQRVLSPRESR
jgi:YVTN family beta-propeller protein